MLPLEWNLFVTMLSQSGDKLVDLQNLIKLVLKPLILSAHFLELTTLKMQFMELIQPVHTKERQISGLVEKSPSKDLCKQLQFLTIALYVWLNPIYWRKDLLVKSLIWFLKQDLKYLLWKLLVWLDQLLKSFTTFIRVSYQNICPLLSTCQVDLALLLKFAKTTQSAHSVLFVDLMILKLQSISNQIPSELNLEQIVFAMLYIALICLKTVFLKSNISSTFYKSISSEFWCNLPKYYKKFC